jgi:cytochrome b pre-mRNA-processing protein 3
MFRGLFRPNPEKTAAMALYRATAHQARQPGFFRDHGVADDFDGRFDCLALHAALIIRRLKREGEPGRRIAQRYFDILFRELDQALREEGIGDLSVGKKIKAMVSAFYGRAQAYDEALSEGTFEALSAALVRNLYRSDETGQWLTAARPMARYAVSAAGALNAIPGEAVLRGDVVFPALPPRAGDTVRAA